MTSLFISMKYKKDVKTDNKTSSLFIIFPSFIEWIVTIVILFLYIKREQNAKKEIQNIIDSYINKKKMKYAIESNIKNLSKKLRMKSQYYEHTFFKDLLIGIILFFIPLALKVIFFKKLTNRFVFLISSLFFYGIMFMKSLLKIIILKTKKRFQTKTNNVNYYEKKYPRNEGVYLIKQNIQNFSSIFSENYMNFSYFFCKFFFGLLFILYFTQIGEKIDDPIKGCSWKILFIPIYILYGPILAYTIIHLISVYSYFKAKIIILFFTVFPSIFAFMLNGILIPMILEKRIEVSPYIIPISFFGGTLFLGIHLTIVSCKITDNK